MALNIIILAAGQGKRMNTRLPKVMHILGGLTLLERVIHTASQLNPEKIYVVYGHDGEHIRRTISIKQTSSTANVSGIGLSHLKEAPITWIEQAEQLGTGHAVNQVLPYLNDKDQVLILYGDVPIISFSTLEKLLKHTVTNGLGLLVTTPNNPFGLGRILRNHHGEIIAIVEQKDANTAQQKIQETNTGIMVTSAKNLKKWLPTLKTQNVQQEYYLTDIVAIAVSHACPINDISVTPDEVRGVNNLVELAQLERIYQRQRAEQFMLEGVMIADPERLEIRGEINIAPNAMIDINVILEGHVSIGENCMIGPNTVLRDVIIGENVTIKSHCVIEDAILEDHCIIGPFARIRPGSRIGQHARVGNFVEIKNTTLGENSKVPHLSYVGDTKIGQNVNMGAGTITVNYDGIHKHQTIIKDNAFVGCNSALIAPVEIGENAYIAAGSTITANAPPNQLTIARTKQRSIERWKPKHKRT